MIFEVRGLLRVPMSSALEGPDKVKERT